MKIQVIKNPMERPSGWVDSNGTGEVKAVFSVTGWGYEPDKANCPLIADKIEISVNVHDDLVKALSRWNDFARDNGYSTDPAASGYVSFLAETQAALKLAGVE